MALNSKGKSGGKFFGLGLTRFLTLMLSIIFLLSIIPAILPVSAASVYHNIYTLMTISSAAFISIYIYYHTEEGSHFRKMLFHLSLFMFLWWSAELLWIYYSEVLQIRPYPSIADLFWLSGYVPLSYIILYTLGPYIRYIGIKTLLVIIPPLSGIFYFVFVPLLADNAKQGISPLETLFNLTYVLSDLGILVLVTFLVVIYNKKKLKYYWLFIAGFMGLVLAGDMLYTHLKFQGLYYPGSLPDSLHTLAYAVYTLGMFVLYRQEMEFRTIEELEERLLENVINSSPDSIITTSVEGIITLYNKDGAKIFGYTPKDAVGTPFVSLFPEDGAKEINQCMKSVLAEDGTANLRTKAKNKNGGHVDISLSLSQLRDGEGNLLGLVGISKDITMEVKAERELQRAYEEMKALNEMKKNIIANVSHELRTPLMIAKSSMELAVEMKSEKERKKFLDMGIASLAKQNLIIENLIKAAMIDKAELNMKPETCDLREAIKRASKELEAEAKKKTVKIKVSLEKDIPKVIADPANLDSVLRNLLSNAVKFNKKGGTVTIEAAKNGKKVEVKVKDTGIGIAPEHHQKIFNRFYQVDSGLARKYDGTGMGLAICRGIVEAYGGRIWVKSALGQGSSFHFTLPIY